MRLPASSLAHIGPANRSQDNRPVLLIALLMTLAFGIVAAQVLRLALVGGATGAAPRAQVAEPLVRVFARPDIVDRKGRMLASDLPSYSLFADPTLIVDVDEASERIARLLPELDQADLRASLADRSRRFVWIKRQLPPALAQRLHDLGLAGIAFRTEPRRIYPQGRLAGHVLGHVSVDNRGMSSIERFIDETMGLESGFSADYARPPVALTIDIGAQHALEEELALGMAQFGANGAAGVILDVDSGAIVAAASLPDIDPSRPSEVLLGDRIDRLSAATYELGSVLKIFTAAMAIDLGLATASTTLDVRVPLQVGRWTIRDNVAAGRPLTVREVISQSSNIGAAKLALLAGATRQRSFLARAGLTSQMRLETGLAGAPRMPERWSEVETATIAYGYGLALSPIQLAAAAAALVNGGVRVQPHFTASLPGIVRAPASPERVVSEATSREMRTMLRRAVTEPKATGRRADAAGFEVGGKTGTAEMAQRGGYQAKSVVASFLGAFPMSAPRYVVLVTLMEPRPAVDDGGGRITAGVNAAPIAGRVIARTGALLGVMPR